MDTQNHTTLIASTYHSRIEKISFNNMIAVKKTTQRRTEKTIKQWETELKVLQLVAKQADTIMRTMSLLLASDFEELSLTLRLESGQSLDQHVSQTMMCTLDPQDSDLLWLNMGSAIGFLHSQLVIHDDVKPDNIVWIPEQRRAVLIDFGAAIVVNPEEAIHFNPSGTPPYAPPEFLDRRKGFEGDIWALGVAILFAKQCIKLPDGDWILPHCFGQEEPLRKMRAWLSEIEDWKIRMVDTDEVLARMLEANPDRRLTGKEMMESLEKRAIP